MKTTLLKLNSRKLLGDLQTPVGLYLKIRDLYKHSVLLESSDYHTAVNSNSYIAFSPMASYKVENESICMSFPDGKKQDIRIQDKHTVADSLNDFIASFQLQGQEAGLVNGFFGYTAYGAVRHFEDLSLSAFENPLNAESSENSGSPDSVANPQNASISGNKLPEMQYVLYKYVIGMNHYRNEISVTENLLEGESSRIQDILHILESPNIALYDFQTTGPEVSDITDEDYRAMVSRGKAHCYRGDVFQIVLSRRF
ncbi:MAG: anthranilate synthase component I family protein, partial [Bacteroidales bacterium]|nr:anthranilate synthase component I family protein [Bacteroidales bacterium]